MMNDDLNLMLVVFLNAQARVIRTSLLQFYFTKLITRSLFWTNTQSDDATWMLQTLGLHEDYCSRKPDYIHADYIFRIDIVLD